MIASTAQAIARKLGEATPRERAGLGFLAAVVALTAGFYALEWASASSREAARATAQFAEREAMLSVFSNDAFRNRLALGVGSAWRSGLAADELASEEMLLELEAYAQQAGFADVQVALLEPIGAQGRVGLQPASLSATFDWAAMIALLEALESAERSYGVQSIDVVEEDGAQRLSLAIGVPVLHESGAP
jgi:hypothetical protein